MKRITFTLLILALLIGFSPAARAELDDGTAVPASVVRPLMSWVEKELGVKVPYLPNVVASRTQLLQVVSRMGPLAGRARALYIGGTVLLDSRIFDAEESTQLSFLLHELVHYAQTFRHVPAGACAQAREYEAYSLQNKWLQEQGHAPIVSASWIKKMASCPADTTIALAQSR